MDNQHKLIVGYRDLSEDEIGLMNRVKELAGLTGTLVENLKTYQAGEPGQELDQRWIAIGATELQQGFMALVRGIARPTTF